MLMYLVGLSPFMLGVVAIVFARIGVVEAGVGGDVNWDCS
jgi:hypothetical protein